jgi:hypothetical protein
MKHFILIPVAVALTSCTGFDQKLKAKTGLDTLGWVTLGISAKLKGEQLKEEYENLQTITVTAQK